MTSRVGAAGVTQIGDGIARPEGPLVTQDGRLLVTGMTDGRIYEIAGGTSRELWVTYGLPNGLAESKDGRVFVAQAGTRSRGERTDERFSGGVQVVATNGTIDWLTQDPIGPNDLCFGPDALLYVTDPTRQVPRDDGRIWRCDPDGLDHRLLRSVDWYPNGIAFGLEGDALYVASTSAGTIVRFPVSRDGLGPGEVFATLPCGVPDGIAFAADGTLIACAIRLQGLRSDTGDEPGELQAFDREGRLVDRLRPGSSPLYTNVAIDERGVAFVTDTTKGCVLAIEGWCGPGLPLHPFRRAA